MKLLQMWNNMDICFQWISWVFKFSLLSWHGSISRSVQPPRVKTYECKDPRLQPSNDTGYALSYFNLLSYFLFLFSLPPPLSYVSNTFVCLTAMLLHQTQTATQSCSPVFYLHLFFFTSLSLWVSGTVSLRSTKQIVFPLLLPNLHSASWTWLRPGFIQKTQQPLLRSLTTSPSLTPPSD